MDLTSLTPITDRLSAGYLEHYALLPLERADAIVRVATWQETPDPQALDDLRLLFDAEIELTRGPEADLRAAVRRVYAAGGVTAERVIAEIPAEAAVGRAWGDMPLDDLVSLANQAPVVKLVNLLLLEALEARASDVHIEAYADLQRVRYRIDGVLQEAPSPPPQLAAAVVSRLKIMAELDIAERRVPQDGRIRLRLQDRQVDVRVATVPTLHGESIVLRLLDRDQRRNTLVDLGMAPDTLEVFSQAISRPHGIVLVTGPTGSGKTTTLYAALEHLRTGREKILTVEDPVEYELLGIAQVPVNEKVGLTFASALRALLRQDPDVILVGEIRDQETAEIAVHAALTGHLVLSTLHTNDASSAITRLVDLGVAPYLLAGTVESIVAQRLVRVLCPECKAETRPTGAEREILGAGVERVWSPAGCAACRHSGFRGRTGIYEVLTMTEPMRRLVVDTPEAAPLKALALANGMRELSQDAIRLVVGGVTSLDEAMRLTEPGLS